MAFCIQYTISPYGVKRRIRLRTDARRTYNGNGPPYLAKGEGDPPEEDMREDRRAGQGAGRIVPDGGGNGGRDPSRPLPPGAPPRVSVPKRSFRDRSGRGKGGRGEGAERSFPLRGRAGGRAAERRSRPLVGPSGRPAGG